MQGQYVGEYGGWASASLVMMGCAVAIYIKPRVIMSVMLLVNVVMVIFVLGAGEVDSSGHVDRGLAALWPPVTIFRPSLRRPTTLRSMSTQL